MPLELGEPVCVVVLDDFLSCLCSSAILARLYFPGVRNIEKIWYLFGLDSSPLGRGVVVEVDEIVVQLPLLLFNIQEILFSIR